MSALFHLTTDRAWPGLSCVCLSVCLPPTQRLMAPLQHSALTECSCSFVQFKLMLVTSKSCPSTSKDGVKPKIKPGNSNPDLYVWFRLNRLKAHKLFWLLIEVQVFLRLSKHFKKNSVISKLHYTLIAAVTLTQRLLLFTAAITLFNGCVVVVSRWSSRSFSH